MDGDFKGSFKYGPKEQETNISWRIKNDPPEEKKRLTSNQLETIKNVFATQIQLDNRKNHKIEIKVLKEGAFSVRVDNKSEFFISRNKDVKDQAPTYVVLQEKIKNDTLFGNVKEFFRAFANLFYKPAFPISSFKERPYRQAVQQDYRALHISLKSGQEWLKGKVANETLKNDVGNCVENAKQIEKALGSRHPKGKLDQLAEKYSKNILDLKHPNSFTVPTGYINNEGALQPVMVRFYRNEGSNLYFEMYSDTTEVSGKTPPTITKKFEFDQFSLPDYKELLNNVFSPLLTHEIGAKKLYEATEPSKTFTSIQEKMLNEKKDIKKSKTEEPSKEIKTTAPTVSLTYETFVRHIEGSWFGGSWTDVPPEKFTRQPGSPAARVTKWFDHLGGDQKLTKNEKLNLLFELTQDWVDSRLSQLSKKVPLQKRLEVYKESLAQIEHVKTKLAIAINEGSPLDSQFGIPKTLLAQEKRCRDSILQIEQKIRKQSVEASGKTLNIHHDKELKIPIQKPLQISIEDEKSLKKESEPVKKSELRGQFAENINKLKSVLSPEQRDIHQTHQMTSNLLVILNTLDPENLMTPEMLKDLIFENGKLKEEGVKTLIQTLLVQTGYIAILKGELGKHSSITEEQLASVIQQLILEPTKLPKWEGKFSEYNKILLLLKRAQDPNSSPPNLALSSFEALRVLLNIRNVNPEKISNESKTTFYTSLQESVASAIDTIDALKRLAANTKNPDEKRALLEEIKLHSLTLLKMLPPPGTEGSQGIPSIWADIPKSERTAVLNQIHEAEQTIWQAQMQLGKSEMNGKERFLLIKAQAIRQAIVRTEVRETQKGLEKILSHVKEKFPIKYNSLSLNSLIEIKNGAFKFKKEPLKPEDMSRINKALTMLFNDEELTEVSKDWNRPDAFYLGFEDFTLNTTLLNQLLSQDLTACLSENAEMEGDLLAVYHFVLRDQNKGRSEGIDIKKKKTKKEIEQQEKQEEKYPEMKQKRIVQEEINKGMRRKPFLSKLSEQSGQFEFAGEEKNLVAEYSKTDIKNPEIYTLIEQMEKGEFYYQTALDPDFTLHNDSPIEGVSYFQSNPETLLSQETFDLEIHREKVQIVGKNKDEPQVNVPLVQVSSLGDKKLTFTPSESEKTQAEGDLRIRKKTPFLPVVGDNGPRSRVIEDLRTEKSFDVWLQYVSSKSEEEVLSIPPFVLQKLFQIRQKPTYSKNICSNYTSDTAINALTFLTDPAHQGYLQHDFVQQFIEETLSGSFIMQQALIANPELVMTNIGLLKERIVEAQKNGNLEVVGFLTNVLKKMKTHAEFSKKEFERSGWFSGLVNGSLPVFIDINDSGFLGNVLTFFDHHNPSKENSGFDKWGETGNKKIDSLQFEDPLKYRKKKLEACIQLLEESIPKNPMEFYFDSEKRPIDKVTNPEIRKQLTIHALQHLRAEHLNGNIKELTTQAYVDIFIGCRLLLDPSIVVGQSSQQEEILAWFRESILPQFHKMDIKEKTPILTNVLNHELKSKKQPEITNPTWKHLKSTDDYKIKQEGKEDIVFNLFSMDISGTTMEKRGVESCYIPSDLLERADMKQALNKEKIFAKKTVLPGNVSVYTWTEEGQKFTLTDGKGTLSLKREISTSPYKGTYIFTPIEILTPNNAAELLLQENGLWIPKGGELQGVVFTKGTSKPSDEDTYMANISVDSKILSLLKPGGELFISTSAKLNTASPLLFASSHQIVTLEKDGEAVEMRLKGTDLTFKKEEGCWICYQGKTNLGKLKLPERDDALIQNFGEQWDRYVIPLETKENTFQYVCLPYGQEVDSKGHVTIIHSDLKELPQPEILSLSPEFGIKGSPAAELYLAHRLIAQAAQTKNTTLARNLLMQAERHLQNISNERPPSGKAELENLSKLLRLIQKNPAVDPSHAFGPEALASSLRLSLLVRNFRKMSEAQGFKTLQLSPEDNFNEMESLSKLYEAYTVMEKKEYKLTGRVDKERLALTEQEKAHLIEINLRCLKDIPNDMPKISDYFGSTGRLVTKLELEHPEKVDSQFLLTLIRIAKPVNDNINILDVKPPIPLDMLLENFWSYLTSIKEKNVSPDQLLFLFESSLLPPARTEEEEIRFKNLDKQVRQFLLAMASMQKEIGKEDPTEKSRTILKNITKEIKELGGNTRVTEAINKNPLLQQEFKNILNLAEKIQLQTLEKSEIETLNKQLGDLKIAVANFSEKISDLPQTENPELPILKQTEQVMIAFQKGLENGISAIGGMAASIELLREIDNLFKALKETLFEPSKGLTLPENKKSKELIEKLLGGKEDVSISFKEKWSIVKELGLKKGIQLAKTAPQLQEQLTIFAAPLYALVEKGKSQSEPITVEGKTKGMETPPSIEKLKNHKVAKQVFTDKEFETIEKRFKNMDPKAQGSFLEKLSSSLDRTEKLLIQQVEIERNNVKQQEIFDKRFIEKNNIEKPTPLRIAVIGNGIQNIKSYYTTSGLIQEDHKGFVDKLINTVLPEDETTLYAQDLKKGFEKLKENNPLPNADIINIEQLPNLEKRINERIISGASYIQTQEDDIIKSLKNIPLKDLPKSVQNVLLTKGSKEEVLTAVLKEHRKGVFGNKKELDNTLNNYLIYKTQHKALERAQKKITELTLLTELKTKDGVQKLTTNNELKNLFIKKPAIRTKWTRLSSEIFELTNRCQETKELHNLSDKLKPHSRKILYLQQRLGIVLRENQLQTLAEIIENPALLKELRMGLGKTSVILPFALEILASEGYNPIGMVPRALFDTNFKEMDETTRLVFELAGNQFLFSRQDAPQPFSTPTLQMISQKCLDFLSAFENGSYILSTIESKGSLDDKIIEVLDSQSKIMKQIEKLNPNDPKDKETIERLEKQVNDHQMVLKQLSRVKSVFEHENTRILVDEFDQVARANYAINSEVGQKQAPSTLVQETISSIFTIIRESEDTKDLKKCIFENNQFTLDKTAVDSAIKEIGKIWLEKNKDKLPENLKENFSAILDWFAGRERRFETKDIGDAFLKQLNAMRKGLNSALRSSLGNKIGSSCDFDPTHNAVGIPASQGITSKTTKYSDPMMQLCLSQMVALYKPQGEEFLKAASVNLLDTLEKQLDKKPEEKGHLEKGIEVLKDLLGQQKEGKTPSFSDKFKGDEPWAVFMRQKFAEQVAPRKLIYVSENQIGRPVQHALRGCHVIGLTGTATRNTEHVVKSVDPNTKIDTPRESTAEVVYRFVKALPNGLDTPVKTYPSDTKKALEQFKGFAKIDSGYNFLVNQAGVCDKLKLIDIVKELHAESHRPIVFMNITEEGSFKSVLINNQVKKLDSLTEEEKIKVAAHGFYYYHTPHVRGTHFDIPTGSKGALMLSPTINANSRDQAIYRARELGEGHTVEPFISEKQHEELAEKYEKPKLNISPIEGKKIVIHDPEKEKQEPVKHVEPIKKKPIVTIGQVLKTHHEQTQLDESKEDLAAYKLHIQGILLRSAETGLNLLIQGEKDTKTQWKIFDELKTLFIQTTDNETYQNLLDQELNQGGEINTDVYLGKFIDKEIQRAEKLEKALPKGAVKNEISEAIKKLKTEKQNLGNNWETLQKQLPKTVSGTSGVEETSETEAEGEEEAQEEQETTSETASDLQRKKRQGATRSILSELDQQLLDEIQSEPILPIEKKEFPNILTQVEVWESLGRVGYLWDSNMLVSAKLHRQFKESTNNTLPDMKLVIIPTNNKNLIVAVDSTEGNQISEPNTDFSSDFNTPSKFEMINAFTVQPTFEQKGDLKLVYAATTNFMVGKRDEYKKDNALQAEMLLTLIYLGFTELNEEQWNMLKDYWVTIPENKKGDIEKAFKEEITKKNPGFLDKFQEKLSIKI